MAERLGRDMSFTDLVVATMTQDRPVVAAPAPGGRALWEGVFGHEVTSKRSFVYHGFITLEATLWGFALGIVMGWRWRSPSCTAARWTCR